MPGMLLFSIQNEGAVKWNNHWLSEQVMQLLS